LDDQLRTIAFNERQSKNEVIRNLLSEALTARETKVTAVEVPEMAVQLG
jgi:hypothetical protein